MTLKTFRGREVQGILKTIRRELGDDVVIVDTRELPDNSVEISVDAAGCSRQPVRARRDIIELQQDQIVTAGPDELQAFGITSVPPQRDPALEQPISQELMYRLFAGQGIAPDLGRMIFSAALRTPARRAEEATLDATIARGLSALFPIDSRLPSERRAVAFFGATGVGKTTTIAKLAAQVRMAFDSSIALISADNYRVGAGYQLQTYASLMNLPFRAIDPLKPFTAQLRDALTVFAGYDLVLIDTAGCNPREAGRVIEMAESFDALPDVERMLVLPAPGNTADLAAGASAFDAVGYSRVIISKLDETGFIGPVLNTVHKINRPIAFLTTGQRVPEDIEPASARRLGWMVARYMH